MRLIKKLACLMEDEVHGAKEYAVYALELQYSRPQLANLLHDMAQTEMKHYSELHEHTAKIIEEFKQNKSNIPEKMILKWEQKHKELIACAEETQTYINMY